ncbi:hypothetical protein ABZZ17_07435 [Streptomyces sp. NPDC006512]|uniref:hypothetical protein n=1 Tax=Streptomyces sp. NPDC006512 TaxID=3154307 RepID=UPI00339FFB6E
MTLTEGRRVRLAADLRLIDSLAEPDGSPAPQGAPAGSLSLAAGTEGTVERAVEDRHESEGVREYQRLASLLDSFGRDMPAESKKRLEEQVAALEPEWIAHQERGPLVTVRVRFDNGFVLDGVRAGLFLAD